MTATDAPTLEGVLAKWGPWLAGRVAHFAAVFALDPDDLRSEALLRLVGGWPRYDGRYSVPTLILRAVRWAGCRMVAARAKRVATVSGSLPVGDGEDGTLLDVLADGGAPDPAEEADAAILRERIREAVAALPGDERESVRRWMAGAELSSRADARRRREAFARLREVLSPCEE